MIKCPVCRAAYKASTAQASAAQASTAQTSTSLTCRRCGAELTALIRLHDQALWHYNQAIAALHQSDLTAALSQIQQAIALNTRQADFQALAGQIWALQGEWQQAIAAWQMAQQLDPNCARAIEALHLVAQFQSAAG